MKSLHTRRSFLAKSAFTGAFAATPLAAFGQGLEHAVERANLSSRPSDLQITDVRCGYIRGGHSLFVKVYTNQGPKGPALRAILDEYAPSRAVFIDDLAQHHRSASEITPEVIRLHFCGEPLLAPHIDCAHRAGDAHARIDTWAQATPWLLEKLQEETV